MSASTNFNFPSHPTSRSHAMQIVEGTRALQQSPALASSTSKSSSAKNNYAESTTSTSSFSSRTSLLKDKFRSSFGSSSSSSPSSSDSSNSNTKSSVSSNSKPSKPMTSTSQQGLFLLGSQIRMGH
ncbi:hypothetical protein B0H65DRAFT_552847 [Neurospora tetraspora]|uniref:Uncharacterized protein n=1 Tax=Neurospora tetraspora TaxID=94610 RepID=A0AAE0J8A5_9PEZI|nr:hypothetical protein B0H65DRAFT_552847 [Neurospora tetraspora]